MTTSKPDGGNAFPSSHRPMFVASGDGSDVKIVQDGMTLRDWFAGMALAGPIADSCGTAEFHAEIAYEYSDAMLKAREQ